MSKTLIHAEKETKDAIIDALGEMPIEGFLQQCVTLFRIGDLMIDDGLLVIRSGGAGIVERVNSELDDSVLNDFKTACAIRSMDWEYGLRKVTGMVRDGKI